MESFPLTPVLAAAGVAAGICKGFFGYSEGKRRRIPIGMVIFLLLAAQLGANVVVGYFTMKRFWKCGVLARITFFTASIAGVILWILEATITFAYLNKKPRDEYKRGLTVHSLLLTLKLLAATVAVGFPAAVAVIRSELFQPLEECSRTLIVDSIVSLLFSFLAVFAFVLVLLVRFLEHTGAYRCGIDHLEGLSIVGLLTSSCIFPVGVAMIAWPHYDRQLMVHGLIVLVPPVLTSAVTFMKFVFLPDFDIGIANQQESEEVRPLDEKQPLTIPETKEEPGNDTKPTEEGVL